MANQAGIQKGERVCVTGATGFIGSHVVACLLERGYAVRGTVRDPSNTAATAHLTRLAEQFGGELELVAADLTQPGAFDAAVADCPYVCHVASSVRLTARDPQREIVDVAVDGTNNVLNAIINAGCARRVVITSSIAAVVDERRPPDYLHGALDWNESASVEDSPYQLSKVLAEKTAWARVATLPAERRFALVTINPTMVLGPILSKEHARSSPSLIRDLLTGAFPMVPNFHFGLVDVRNVARAHVIALEQASTEGRYIINTATKSLVDVANMLRKAFPDRKIPQRPMPDALMYIAALFDKRLTWAFLRANLSIERQYDVRRSYELGIQYFRPEVSAKDTAQSLIELGVV